MPKSSITYLYSFDSDGKQIAALRYDLSVRGQRQRCARYAESERERGRRVEVTEVLIEAEGDPGTFKVTRTRRHEN